MRTVDVRAITRLAALGVAAMIAAPAVVYAQAGQTISSQLDLRSSDAGKAMSAAMSTLATDPRNLAALLTAGESALTLEDPRSALGFFGRADDVSPNNGRVKAGLGRAMLLLDQVGDGLRLMEQAGNLGYSDAGLLADRGLARDLTGNQRGAQQDYAAALQLDPGNAKVIRRRAVSHGISGQPDVAQAMLQPLLYKSDRGAWRDRAFILAMNGKTREAMDIAHQVMPRELADAIKPYLERMAMLSPAQRAAAVHLGQFPPGLVSMPIGATAVPVQAAEATPPASAVPARRGRKGDTGATARNAAAAAPVTTASVPAARPVRREQTASPQADVAMAPNVPPRPVVSVPPAAAARAAAPASRPPAPAPARAVQGPPAPAAQAAVRPPSTLTPAPAPQPSPAPMLARAPSAVPVPAAVPPARPLSEKPDRTLADIIADIDIPVDERQPRVAPVNLSEIATLQAAQRKAREANEAKARKEAARKKAEAEAKAKAAAEKKRLDDNPARYWVQVGVGRNEGALAFTLRRMKKQYAGIAKKDGWSASWGQTNRLVVGPFSSLAKAKDAEAELRKGGSDAFVWRSEAGEVLDRVGD